MIVRLSRGRYAPALHADAAHPPDAGFERPIANDPVLWELP